MSNEYPREQELKRIEKWNIPDDLNGLLEFIEELWKYSEYFIRKDNLLELHTGGWSGNEDIIFSLERNTMFYCLYWQKSERGGHYYFVFSEGTL